MIEDQGSYMAFFCLKNKGRNPLESDLNIYIYMINSVTTKLFILLHIQISGGFMGATRVLGQLDSVQSKHHSALEGVGQQDRLWEVAASSAGEFWEDNFLIKAYFLHFSMWRKLFGCFWLPTWGVTAWWRNLTAGSKLDTGEVTQFIRLPRELGMKTTFGLWSLGSNRNTKDWNRKKLIPPSFNLKTPSHNKLSCMW